MGPEMEAFRVCLRSPLGDLEAAIVLGWVGAFFGLLGLGGALLLVGGGECR